MIVRDRRPEAGPPRPLKLPDFEQAALDNGLEVHYARRSGVPEVSVRLVLEAGITSETPEQAGVSELVSRTITEGAGGRDALGVAEWQDRIGVAFDASTRHDVATVSLHTLSDVLDEALEFMATVVARPRFDPTEVDRVRGERLDEIARERDEPALVADRVVARELFGPHPYARPIGGVRSAVESLDRDAVSARHAGHYRPDGASLIVCGDVSSREVMAALGRHFGGWRGRVEPYQVAEVGPVPEARTVLIHRPGSAQAEIRLGTIGVPYHTRDHYAIVVANAILGGLFNSRINMNLREDKGWTYGARSAFHFRRQAGPFVARTAVDTEVTAAALGELKGEIRRMRDEVPSDEELTLARNALTLSLPRQFETASQVTRRVSTQRVHRLPEDYWEAYGERISAVTGDEVRAVCRTYLPDERLTAVVVTDAEIVERELAAAGPLERRTLDDIA